MPAAARAWIGGALTLAGLACGARTGFDNVPPGVLPAADSGVSDGPSSDAPADGAVQGGVPAPRPISPLSTSSVTTQQPTFQWLLPSGADGARVEVCADRACTVIESAFDRIGSSGAPPVPLAAGVHFFRLRGLASGVVGTSPSVTWEIVVPRRSAPRDASWGTLPDFNGDGYGDVVVAGRFTDVTVFPGSPSGVSTTKRVELTLPSETITRVASAGDVDGDGYADLVVGTGVSTVSSMVPSAFLYHGGPNGLMGGALASLTFPPPAPNLGAASVGSAGDVNHDGYADIIIGWENIFPGEGMVAIYFGGPTGPATHLSIALHSELDLQSFGFAVAGAGDVDGDGFADVLAFENFSRLLVYRGSASGPSDATRTAIPTPGYQLSYPLSLVPGDVNGDGVADVVIGLGAIGAMNNVINPGGVLMFYGGTTLGAPTSLSPPMGMGSLGDEVSFAGDVNGDGYDDLVAGAPGNYGATTAWGGVVYWGSATGVSDGARATFATTMLPGSARGVSGAGDLNRDGYADVLSSDADGNLLVSPGSAGVFGVAGALSPLMTGGWGDVLSSQ